MKIFKVETGILFLISLLLLQSCFSKKATQNNDLAVMNLAKPTYQNINYKSISKKDSLKLDIYQPLDSESKKHPIIIFIHGGGWNSGSKEVASKTFRPYIINQLLENQFTVISIDYRLVSKTVHFPLPLEDCKDAIRWVRKNATKYHLDSENIGLWGASAGAHLAMLSAYTSDRKSNGEASLAPYSSKVNYVINNFGPTELNQLFRTNASSFELWVFKTLFSKGRLMWRNQIISDITNENIETDSDKTRQVLNEISPLYYTKTAVPTLTIHGTKDRIVSIKQSELLQKKLTENQIENQLSVIKGAGHSFVNIDETTAHQIAKNIVDFAKNQNKTKTK